MITKGNMSFKKVLPYGRLIAEGKEYYLLSPYPVQPDWDTDCKRFVATPATPIDHEGNDNLYAYARHVVISGAFLIEYLFTEVGKSIYVWQLPNEYDVITNKENPVTFESPDEDFEVDQFEDSELDPPENFSDDALPM